MVVVATARAGSGIRDGGSSTCGVVSQFGLVKIAIDTIRQNNACAVAACVTAIASGNSSSTVIPPSTACTMINPKASMTRLADPSPRLRAPRLRHQRERQDDDGAGGEAMAEFEADAALPRRDQFAVWPAANPEVRARSRSR